MSLSVEPCAPSELLGDPIYTAAAEPSPCDRCEHAKRCGSTAEACSAYSAYFAGRAWGQLPRVPSATIGRKLRLGR